MAGVTKQNFNVTQEAPVVARAGVLLECAHFIHRCNRGDWPSWMKHNLPSFRHNVHALQNRGQPSGYRRNLVMQRAAGRLFYSWAEVREGLFQMNRVCGAFVCREHVVCLLHVEKKKEGWEWCVA